MKQTELLDEPIITEPEIQGIPKWRRPPRWLLIIVAVAFIIIFAWLPGVVFYTDWLWFKDLGYQTVFSTMLVTKVTLGLTVGLLAAAFTWLNFGLAVRPSHEPANVQEVSRETGEEAGWEAGPRSFVINGQRIPAPDLARLAGRLALPAAVAIGAYAGLLAGAHGTSGCATAISRRSARPIRSSGATSPSTSLPFRRSKPSPVCYS